MASEKYYHPGDISTTARLRDATAACCKRTGLGKFSFRLALWLLFAVSASFGYVQEKHVFSSHDYYIFLPLRGANYTNPAYHPEFNTLSTTASGTISVTAIGSDVSGIAGVQFKVDGNNLGTEDTMPPYELTIDTTAFSNGAHVLTAVARGAARHQLTSSGITVNVDNPALVTFPGGFVQKSFALTPRPRLTASQIAGFLPSGRGKFTFPPPYNTEGIRITVPADCAGTDCLSYVGYAYWKNTNNHTGSNEMLIFLTLRGYGGPTLFSYDKTTDAVTKVGPLFDANSAFSSATGEGWYFSGTQATKLYLNSGSKMLRYDVVARTFQTVFDISTRPDLYGTNRYVWQMHSSDDDRVHMATVRDKATYAMLGCAVYAEGTQTFSYYPTNGGLDECNLDKSGRWLMLLENNTNRIVDLQSGTQTLIVDQSGALGHLDMGDGYAVGSDNWNPLPNATVLVKFPVTSVTRPISPVVHYNPDWNTVKTNHVTHQNRKSGVSPEQQYACGTNLDSINRENEIVCYRLDGSFDELVVAPVMGNMSAPGGGDNYSKMPKGNTDVTGNYFIWTTNLGGSRLDAILVKVPSQLLLATDTASPTVSITAPGSGQTISGTITVTASASDNVGVVGVQFKVDGANLGAEITAAPYAVAILTTALSNGSHVLTAVARDAAGNQATSGAVSVTVSNLVSPAIAGISPNSGLQGSSVTAAITGSNLTGASLVTFSGSGVTATVNAGGTAGSLPVTIAIAATAATGPRTFTVTTPGGTASSGALTFNVTAPAPPTATTRYEQNDPAVGYSGAWFNNNLSRHSAGSAVQAVDAGARATFTFIGTAVSWVGYSDRWSGIANVYLDGVLKGSVDTYASADQAQAVLFSVNGLASATHTLVIEATRTRNPSSGGSWVWVDAFDVVAASAPVPDTTLPVVAISAPASGQTISGTITATATASDNVGVAGVQFKVDGVNLGAEVTAAPYAVAILTTALSNGSHVLTAVARDAAGNQATSSAVNVTVNNLVSPAIAGISPNSGLQGSSVTATITGSSLTGASLVTFSGSGVTATVNAGGSAGSLPVTIAIAATAATGPRTFTVTTPGGTANSGALTFNVTAPAPPTATTRYEQNDPAVGYSGAWFNNNLSRHSAGSAVEAVDAGARATFTFTGTAVSWVCYSDRWSGIANVYLDGVLKGSVDTYASVDQAQAVLYSVSGLASSTHTLIIEATHTRNPSSGGSWVWVDAFDLVAASAPAPDTTIPVVAISAEGIGQTVSGTITATATASDNVGVAGVQFKVDGANVGAEINAAPYAVAIVTTALSNGSHVLTAVARDAAGNQATSSAVSVTVNNPATSFESSYSIVNRGGTSLATLGTGALSVGYARIVPNAGSATPAGVAIFGSRQNGILVTEAGVPASPLIGSGRIYAEVGGQVNTGLAIANVNAQPALVNFFFTDANGNDFGVGSTTIGAGGQIAGFLNQAPFMGGATLSGTFTFTSSVPVAAIALRGMYNERNEFLITTLPVADLSQPGATTTVLLPHFADGQGWTSQVVLVNSSDTTQSGTVQFVGGGTATMPAQPVAVKIGAVTASSFGYSIPPRSSRVLKTTGASASIEVGSVWIEPHAGQQTPTGLGIFSYKAAGVTVTEAGVPASGLSTTQRMYAEVTGADAGSVQTGVAVANPSANAVNVNFELTRLNGSATGLSGTLTVPGNGQVARFLSEIPGFQALPVPFQGVLRIASTSSAVSVVGLRVRTNERGDLLITTTPPVNENAPASSAELVLPHFANGGGYTTQFILFSSSANPTDGRLRFFAQSGQPLELKLK